MALNAQAVVAATAVVLSAVQYPRWTRRVIAPTDTEPLYKPVVRTRIVWAADVTGAINAVGMTAVGLLFPATRAEAALIVAPVAVLCWYFLRIERHEGRLNRYPGFRPWTTPSRWGAFRIVPEVLTPGVTLQLVVLATLSL